MKSPSPIMEGYDHFEELKKAQSNPRSNYVFPPVIDGNLIKLEGIVLPKEIIHDMFSLTEKLELAGSSKGFKTWCFIDLALSVANGAPWWGHQTNRTHVVYLNLELSQPFFDQRLAEVAQAKNLEPNSRFHVLHLRGSKLHQPSRWEAFLVYLESLLHRFPEPLLIIDPIYKMLGGKNENSAGDINAMMDQLEDLVQRTRGSNVFGHHFTKGNASDKDAIDRASGSGVFQRDPDVLLVLSPLETPNSYSVELYLRNHRPIPKFSLFWDYPIFIPRNDLDPDDLKKPRHRQPKYKPEELLSLLGDQSLSTTAFEKLARREIGMTASTFFEVLKKAQNLKLISKSKLSNEWERILS